MATQPDETKTAQHWQDLLEALRREAETVYGYGNVTARIVYYEGVPTQIDVLERRSCFRLGRGQPPLTDERRRKQHGA